MVKGRYLIKKSGQSCGPLSGGKQKVRKDQPLGRRWLETAGAKTGYTDHRWLNSWIAGRGQRGSRCQIDYPSHKYRGRLHRLGLPFFKLRPRGS